MRPERRIFAANGLTLNKKFLNTLLFVLLSIIWGSSFRLIKVGLTSLDAYQLASLRILSAGLVLLPFGYRAIQSVSSAQRQWIALSGILGTFFPAYFFCIAETRIDSSLAGILNALTPLFTLSIGVALFRHPAGWKKWVGVAMGFGGLAILLFAGAGKVSLSNLSFASFVLLATCCYGLNVNLVNRHLQGVGSRDIAAIAFSVLIPPALLILWQTDFFSLSWSSQGFMVSAAAGALLGVVGTAFASVLFYVLLKRAGPLMASMVTYGIPFVAIFWGWLAGEGISAVQIGGLMVILGGVYLASE
ncbi:MAG: DMT family transporter [Bacteroidetes bacterium]|nr:DMT family transporter [Bacteroidota bacterium]